eukprot:543152-Prorocentrum_minimum.AAC.4
MRGLLPPTPSGTPPGGASRGARLVRSPGEAGHRRGRYLPRRGALTIKFKFTNKERGTPPPQPRYETKTLNVRSHHHPDWYFADKAAGAYSFLGGRGRIVTGLITTRREFDPGGTGTS